VWVISAFYLLSAGWTLLSFALIFNGAIKVNSAQEAYFASLTSIDWFFSLSIAVIGLAGAISLFLLRRIALVLFALALVLNLALTVFQMIRTNRTEALGGAGLFGVLLGWAVLVAVILYTNVLRKRSLLS
jgi:hypothetical protein